MKLPNIVKYRLQNQQITGSQFKTGQDVVNWMGAMQAQDFNMSKWALGTRLSNATEKLIEKEYNEGKILRTHLMRPTWHLVSSEDIYWMLELTVPRIKSATKTRHKHLGLSEDLINRCFKIIEKALEKSIHLTREEIVSEISKNKIATDNNRASHIMLCAEMEGLVCSGPIKKNKLTYALLEQRVPNKKTLLREEALKILAKKYFTSHGPATIPDFVWWSGLTVSDAKKGLDSNKEELNSLKIGQDVFWSGNRVIHDGQMPSSLYLLPAFDEYIIGYRNRDAMIVLDNFRKVISSNGIFRPVVVINGTVAGAWKREIKKDKVNIEIDLFEPGNDEILLLFKEQVERFGNYLDKKTDIRFEKQKPLK